MCTVTYLPYRDGFILTHNRDEAPTRSPHLISREKRAGSTLIFPKDTKAGGAWIAASDKGATACLLNGAFVKHSHEPPYRRSRGLVLLDFFDASDPEQFFSTYELAGIEPFTLLFFRKNQVEEFRWDGERRHHKSMPPDQPHFWCSATLYPPVIQALREQVFEQWLEKNKSFLQPTPGYEPPEGRRLPSRIYRLHLTGGIGDPENNFVMNRSGRVRTVSITQVVCREGKFRMRYADLLEGFRNAKKLRIRG